MFQEFIPKSYLYLRSGYSFSTFKKDLVAGITVGVIALPLAMAFAISSGVSPERGLTTAIIAGFLISALGGSRIQIGGPTGAFVVLVFDIVQRNGYEGLAVSTLIASVLLIFLGLCRLGSCIKYIPHPLVTGFTSGIAVIIFSSQIRDFLGLDMKTVPADFLEKWMAYAQALGSAHPTSCLMGFGTLFLIVLIRRYAPKLPWGITSIIVSTFFYYLFQLPVETIASRFGEIPHSIPAPVWPSFHVIQGKELEFLRDGLSIAFLGGIESLLSAVIGDGMIGGRHKSNCELLGQGIANFFSVLFGGIPATGAIARTAANVKTGAQTPLAGMIHALTLFLIVFFLAPLVSHIPLASLAAVLIMVAWNMSESEHFIHLLKAPKSDVIVLLTSFLLTVFVDITTAIAVGMVLASFFFMSRMKNFSRTVSLKDSFEEKNDEFPERSDVQSIEVKKVPKSIEVYEIQGPFFFGAADMLKDLLVGLEKPPKVFILRLRQATFIDASGMHALKEFYQKCQKEKATLILCELCDHITEDLDRFGFIRLLGKEFIFSSIDNALEKAKTLIGPVDVNDMKEKQA